MEGRHYSFRLRVYFKIANMRTYVRTLRTHVGMHVCKKKTQQIRVKISRKMRVQTEIEKSPAVTLASTSFCLWPTGSAD